MSITKLGHAGIPMMDRAWTAKDPSAPPATPSDILDRVLPLQFVHDNTNNKIHVTSVSTLSTGSRLSIEQIFGDIFDEDTNVFRVVDVGSGPDSSVSHLDATLVLQDCHDPDAHALRVIRDTAVGGTTWYEDWRTILQECHDTVNHAIKVVAVGSSGTPGRSRLEPAHVLNDCYDPGVGLRVSL